MVETISQILEAIGLLVLILWAARAVGIWEERKLDRALYYKLLKDGEGVSDDLRKRANRSLWM